MNTNITYLQEAHTGTRRGRLSNANIEKYEQLEKMFPYYGFAHVVGMLTDEVIRELMITMGDKLIQCDGKGLYVNRWLARCLKFAYVINKAYRHGRSNEEWLSKADELRPVLLFFKKETVLKHMSPKTDMPRKDVLRPEKLKNTVMEWHYNNYINNPDRPFEPDYVIIGEHIGSQGPIKEEHILELQTEFPKSKIIGILSQEHNNACTLSYAIDARNSEGFMHTGEGGYPYYGKLVMEMILDYEDENGPSDVN